METPSFGTVLREARERRQLSLTDLSTKTKVAVSSLQLLEASKIDDLPQEIFVRGFIRSYARAVAITDQEPLGLYDQALEARRRAEEALVAIPSAPFPDEDGANPRRGYGLAVFVIIVLLIATITVGIFLRQPPQSGEGLSLSPPPAPAAAPFDSDRTG